MYNIQEWRRHIRPQMSLKTGKRERVKGMGIVEDFIYLNCRSATNCIQVSVLRYRTQNVPKWKFQHVQFSWETNALRKQIWLRGSQQKVGRISAGSRITSLLTANDIILCGTETGLIKVCTLNPCNINHMYPLVKD